MNEYLAYIEREVSGFIHITDTANFDLPLTATSLCCDDVSNLTSDRVVIDCCSAYPSVDYYDGVWCRTVLRKYPGSFVSSTLPVYQNHEPTVTLIER